MRSGSVASRAKQKFRRGPALGNALHGKRHGSPPPTRLSLVAQRGTDRATLWAAPPDQSGAQIGSSDDGTVGRADPCCRMLAPGRCSRSCKRRQAEAVTVPLAEDPTLADRSVRNTRRCAATTSSAEPRGTQGSPRAHAHTRASALAAHLSLPRDGRLGRCRDRAGLFLRATCTRHRDHDMGRFPLLDEHTASDSLIPAAKPDLDAGAHTRRFPPGIRNICRRDSCRLLWRVFPPARRRARSARESARSASGGGRRPLVAAIQGGAPPMLSYSSFARTETSYCFRVTATPSPATGRLLLWTTRDRLRGRRPGSCFALAKREPTPR